LIAGVMHIFFDLAVKFSRQDHAVIDLAIGQVPRCIVSS